MKRLINILILVSMIVLETSCKKEYFNPNTYPIPTSVKPSNTQTISLWGEFVVVGAIMYTYDNHVGDTTKTDLFNGKISASMIKNGSLFAIDSIRVNITTYSFYKGNGYDFGKFVLNGDTTKHYQLDMISTPTIIEYVNDTIQLMGGSARQLINYQTIDYGQKTVSVIMDDFSGNGTGIEYWTVLTLRKTKEW